MLLTIAPFSHSPETIRSGNGVCFRRYFSARLVFFGSWLRDVVTCTPLLPEPGYSVQLNKFARRDRSSFTPNTYILAPPSPFPIVPNTRSQETFFFFLRSQKLPQIVPSWAATIPQNSAPILYRLVRALWISWRHPDIITSLHHATCSDSSLRILLHGQIRVCVVHSRGYNNNY